MLSRYAAVFLSAALVAVTPSATLAQVATPLPVGRPMTFDLAGVKLGMTVAEAKAALVRSGYRIDHVSMTDTFERKVVFEAGQRLSKPLPFQSPTGVGKIDGYGPHREYLEVSFMQRPGGSIVSSVTVTIPNDAMTAADVRTQLLAKYGRPDSSRVQGTDLSWCSAEVIANCGANFVASGHLDTYYPSLKASALRGGRIVLDIGEQAFEQNVKDQANAIERLAPKTRKGAF